MKKVFALLLTLSLCVGLLSACGGSKTETPASSGSDQETSAPAATGAVYYLNFKPEQDEAWQNLAKAYTEETGVPVTVVTAASGTYEQTLMSEIAKSTPPTLFQVNGLDGVPFHQEGERIGWRCEVVIAQCHMNHLFQAFHVDIYGHIHLILSNLTIEYQGYITKHGTQPLVGRNIGVVALGDLYDTVATEYTNTIVTHSIGKSIHLDVSYTNSIRASTQTEVVQSEVAGTITIVTEQDGGGLRVSTLVVDGYHKILGIFLVGNVVCTQLHVNHLIKRGCHVNIDGHIDLIITHLTLQNQRHITKHRT